MVTMDDNVLKTGRLTLDLPDVCRGPVARRGHLPAALEVIEMRISYNVSSILSSGCVRAVLAGM